MSIEHCCDDCKREPDFCFCEKCLQELKDTTFSDGVDEGKRQAKEESDGK